MMIKTIIILISFTLLFSCYLWEGDEEKFTEVYTEILAIREKIPDSLEASKEIEKVLAEYGYTYESWEEEFRYFYKDSKKFMAMMDTIRERSRREIERLMKEKQEKDSIDAVGEITSKTFTDDEE